MPTSHRYIVAADGRRARFYEQLRRGAALNLVESMDIAAEDRIVPQDRPTRVQESASPMRHGAEGRTNPHEEEEERFLARIVAELASRRMQQKFDKMVLFAPPRALGILRSKLKGELEQAVEASIDLDVVAETPAQLHDRMRQAGLR